MMSPVSPSRRLSRWIRMMNTRMAVCVHAGFHSYQKQLLGNYSISIWSSQANEMFPLGMACIPSLASGHDRPYNTQHLDMETLWAMQLAI